ncbi:FAD-dependent oxidoreductase [Parahaliea aestuarii]|uniref:FAD-dependent oxidoreductase n=1 Tax=Parahaliea aestuarii TaxID=1852021 RepID=A0A5C9A2X3_9GAMM|nr:FAD-dependent oxidoreductase [Parahaliea aestuarii]TXS95066.1 FAD-dependent oxidoreductase [Parahaliea aestuarii]
MGEKHQTGIGRRQLLTGAGAAAVLGVSARPAHPAMDSIHWEREVDVICVGSGAAACSAATVASHAGASVLILEKLPMLGGTTAKSGGVTWIPNNPILRAQGIDDDKLDCLRYLARYAYPQQYTPNSPTLGLRESDYRLLEAFYDNGTKAIEFLQDNDIVKFQQFRMWHVDKVPPDYADHLPENKVPRGRCIEPASGAGASAGGGSLAVTLANWLKSQGVPMLTEHPVTRLIMAADRVVGVEVLHEGNTLNFKARKGVVFGTGGYAHNTDLVSLHQTALYGSCALPGSTGDFIGMAGAVGAQMGALHMAWRTQVLFEEALRDRELGLGAFVLPGDSMIVVNRYGRRVTNEKRNYNDRTRTHFYYDPTREEYPNQLQFMVFDHRSLDAFGGNFPLPSSPAGSRYLIKGDTWDELTANIAARLAGVADQSGGFTLDPIFRDALQDSVERFNGYARKGMDTEFQRGKHQYDSDWHELFSSHRKDTEYPVNPMPSLVMHPFSEQGPYYAFILAAGALDTCGGPVINEHAQVLAADGSPIPGLYGAGNCISSPTRQAYAGAGGTIGPALTFGHIAGRHVMQS